MRNINKLFSEGMYTPTRALLIYKHQGRTDRHYVESFDIGDDGKPVNAHPLSEDEAEELAKRLKKPEARKKGKKESSRFLQSLGILPGDVLYVKPGELGYAIWYTPAQMQPLHFVDSLGIPNGKAYVPAMVWRATCNSLEVFALASKKRPDGQTKLFHAPFFNVGGNGVVCLGTIKTAIPEHCPLELFISLWPGYFFNSYFSHANGVGLTKTNIVQLWQGQVASGNSFPTSALKPTKLTLQSLIR